MVIVNIHLEMCGEFRKGYQLVGNWDGMGVTIERIKGGLEEWDRWFKQETMSSKSLKFEKNDESSWSIW